MKPINEIRAYRGRLESLGLDPNSIPPTTNNINPITIPIAENPIRIVEVLFIYIYINKIK